MKANLVKRVAALSMTAVMTMSLCACGAQPSVDTPDQSAETTTETTTSETTDDVLEPPVEDEVQETETSAEATTYKVGICNYVSDASLDQIVANVEAQLETIGQEYNVTFEILEDNCNADASVLNQIVTNFISEDVDLMVAIATPVAMTMQAQTEGTDIPVVFAAVSDPLSTGLVESMDAPGANLTGTSDYLDTTAIMNLIFAANPETDLVGLLYDAGQDSSTTPIQDAKAYLDEKGIAYVEHTGTNVSEVTLAAEAMVSDGVDAVFTPTDNTVMQAELSIYETLADAGIPHYTGADSFALNGAFVGYGVDYANLGIETANMVKGILIDGNDPATTAVMTFDNGTATVNTEVCEAIGFDFATIESAFAPFCIKVETITTAESFEE